MRLEECNPYIRTAQIQSPILERTGARMAYDYRLFYILEHTGQILIEGEWHEICPDTVIILPPAKAYDFQGQMKTCVLNFDITRSFAHRTQPLFPPCVADFDLDSVFETELLEGFEAPRLLRGDAFTRESVMRLVGNFQTRGSYAQGTASAMLKLLLAELLRRELPPENKLTEKVLSHIRIHAASIRSNSDVAEFFGYHPVYMGELIRRITGKTLHSIIMDAKLQLACQWLMGTQESIDSIAQTVGFCSRTHFCTLFKKKMGISPKEYRKNAL